MGFKWDFILVHESGHEWFGNSITASNDGESWIHEGFTKYLETIYTGYIYGIEAGNDYAIGIWKRIKNDMPVLGTSTSDTYNKSSAMLHMIRQVIGDTVFRGLLQGLNKMFYHKTVNTNQVLVYINHYTEHDFTKVFNQYLKTTEIPLFEYSFQNDNFLYRWTNCINGFDMPLNISFDSLKYKFIYPTTQWQKFPCNENISKRFTVDRNFYIKAEEKTQEVFFKAK